MKKLMESKDLGRGVWVKWDSSADVYELFTSEEARECIGCADTLSEAREVAKEWLLELMG